MICIIMINLLNFCDSIVYKVRNLLQNGANSVKVGLIKRHPTG